MLIETLKKSTNLDMNQNVSYSVLNSDVVLKWDEMLHYKLANTVPYSKNKNQPDLFTLLNAL